MGKKREVRYLQARARRVAEAIVEELRPACERIEIAGSIRREVARVKDIEIVAQPKLATDLFGEPTQGPTDLDIRLRGLISERRLEPRLVGEKRQRRMGDKYKALVAVRPGLPLDLFVVTPPAQWGAIYAIRTGPGGYSTKLVLACQDRGMVCRGGRLLRGGELVATPTERDFIEACGLEYLPPHQRR